MPIFPPIKSIKIVVHRINDNRMIDVFDNLQEAIDYLEDLQTKEYSRGNPVDANKQKNNE